MGVFFQTPSHPLQCAPMALGEFWVIFITCSQLKWSHKKSYENSALKELNYLLYPNNTFQQFMEVNVKLY